GDESLSERIALPSARLLDDSYCGQFRLRHTAGVINGKPIDEYDFVHPRRHLSEDVREGLRLIARRNNNTHTEVGWSVMAVGAIVMAVGAIVMAVGAIVMAVLVRRRQRGGDPVCSSFAAL